MQVPVLAMGGIKVERLFRAVNERFRTSPPIILEKGKFTLLYELLRVFRSNLKEVGKTPFETHFGRKLITMKLTVVDLANYVREKAASRKDGEKLKIEHYLGEQDSQCVAGADQKEEKLAGLFNKQR